MTKRPSESAMAAARPVVYQISDYAPDEPEHEREVMQVARAIDKAVAAERSELLKKFPRSSIRAGAASGSFMSFVDGYDKARAEIREWLRARGAQGGTDE